jgi:hypothetical protein
MDCNPFDDGEGLISSREEPDGDTVDAQADKIIINAVIKMAGDFIFGLLTDTDAFERTLQRENGTFEPISLQF